MEATLKQTAPLKLPRVPALPDPALDWRWCAKAGFRTTMPIERVENGIEYRRCEACGELHEYPVK